MLSLQKRVKLGGLGEKHAIHLFFYGDMHTDDRGFFEKGFVEMTDDIRRRKNALAFQIGDLTDMANSRTREAMKTISKVGGMKDIQVTLDEKASAAEKLAVSLNQPIQNNLVYAVIGNHGWEYYDTKKYGTSLDLNWAEAIGCPISAALATCRITMFLGKGERAASIRVMSRHGRGGATTETGDQNKLYKEMQQYTDVDIFVAGHTHHLYDKKLRSVLGFSGAEPVSFSRHIGRSGTFKRNILTDNPLSPSYEEEAGYSPAGLGYLRYKVWLNRKRRGTKDVIHPHIEGTAVPTD
jgi:predicted phosphodiesterase